MPHHDPDDIALRAVGEHVGEEVAREIDNDAATRSELSSLRGTVSAARRSGVPFEVLEQPPSSVWQNISAAIEADVAPANDGAFKRHRKVAPLKNPARRGISPLRVAAIAACIAAISIVTFNALDTTGVTSVTTTELASGNGVSTKGTATLLREEDKLRLRVEITPTQLPSDHFQEVWLIKADASGLISLGPVRDDSTYDIPDTVDLEAYPIVDVSDEPIDGNPAHSGNTLCRGTLQLA